MPLYKISVTEVTLLDYGSVSGADPDAAIALVQANGAGTPVETKTQKNIGVLKLPE